MGTLSETEGLYVNVSNKFSGHPVTVVRIRYTYLDIEKVFDEPRETVVLGRPRAGAPVDIDLTPDLRVSRSHARISLENGRYWVEDLGSANGTTIDGEPIDRQIPIELRSGQTIGISDTLITVEIPAALGSLGHGANTDETIVARIADAAPELDISDMIDAAAPAFDLDHPIDPSRAQHMALFYELPLRLGEQIGLDDLLKTIVEQLVDMIPAASRGALLLKDEVSGELLLKAHVPSGDPSVSLDLARRAMVQRQGFIWRRSMDPSRSQIANRMETGMYAPLLWKEEALGVVCVDSSNRSAPFVAEDLRLMLAVAHQAASSAMQCQLQDEARRSASLLSRLMTNFSPKVRDRLLNRAHQGRLRLGGERSEVVIIESDIRGFTKLTAGMDADDVVDLLNEYFTALVDALFKHDGTVDKFIGDAILAVFGSPEPDPLRHDHAIRAALAMQTAMREVNAKRKRACQVTCDLGIGIHCGEVLHGFIGSNERMELTIIGEAVNWASRYCAGAGPGEIVISPDMHQRTWRFIESESTSIDTKHEGILPAYRLRGLKSGY
jgi:adenylate cyclase